MNDLIQMIDKQTKVIEKLKRLRFKTKVVDRLIHKHEQDLNKLTGLLESREPGDE